MSIWPAIMSVFATIRKVGSSWRSQSCVLPGLGPTSATEIMCTAGLTVIMRGIKPRTKTGHMRGQPWPEPFGSVAGRPFSATLDARAGSLFGIALLCIVASSVGDWAVSVFLPVPMMDYQVPVAFSRKNRAAAPTLCGILVVCNLCNAKRAPRNWNEVMDFLQCGEYTRLRWSFCTRLLDGGWRISFF